MQIYYTIINRIIQLKSRDRERMANGEWQIVNDDEKKYCQLACLNAILLHGTPPPPYISYWWNCHEKFVEIFSCEHINCVQNINGKIETTEGSRRCVCHQNTQLLCSVMTRTNLTKRSAHKLMHSVMEYTNIV